MLSEELSYLSSRMKSPLVLVALLVLKAFIVVLTSSKINTNNSSETNGQTQFNQHNNMNTMIMSRYTLLNYSFNYIWKVEQYLTFYNNMSRVLSVQISSKESMPSKNKIIRIIQSTFVTNAKQSKNILSAKTSAMNKIRSTSSILQTTYKLKIKAATSRKDLKKKNNNSVFRNGKAEVIISTPQSNTTCNSQKRVWIEGFVCDQLFLAQRRYKQECKQQHYLADLFSTSRCPIQTHQFKLAQSPNYIIKVRLLFCPMLQC
ncbi:hypothetical protein RFI_03091 [Reticulomyxa filosa]|uniref:Uncharacterized protein n=1 Tax=Reticulomyxa filosa TaxID=46433 RepID=X6P7A9_RETFI|nr:hypothetical protein RFI_03091 [Reticulomyxa filosa]|eukprot:ETO34003.1 hypothetical protein RFI_03091 [Reticulomyxa filosa]